MIREKWLHTLVILLVGLSFLTPLVVSPRGFIFPFIVPKIILLRSLVLLMVGVYGGLLSINWEKYRPRMNPLTIAVLAFWVSFAVSTFVGVDWYRSFWDSHERMLGLFTVTHYVLLYLVLVGVVRQEKDWKILIRVFLGAGGLVMVIGLLQKLQPDLLLNNGSYRVSATLGNAIYMSGYGLFLLFFGAVSYVRTLPVEKTWRIYALSTGLLGFIGIFLGGTRGTLLGLMAGLCVMAVCAVGISKESKVRRWGVGILAGIAVIAGLLWMYRTTSFVTSIPAVGRIVSTDFSHIGENTRIMAWGVAWDGFLDKPVFGWGPNNYFYTFNTFYRPEFLRYGYGETWFDNAHNIVMNTLATQGVFGILTYLSIFGVVGYSVFVARKRGQMGDAELIVLVGFFVGHFIHNIFVFENPTSYLYFFFALGYVYVRTRQDIDDGVSSHKSHLSTGTAVGIGISMFLLIFVFNINPAKANRATLHAIQSLYRGEDSIPTYMSAFSVPTPHVDDVRSDLARTVGQIASSMLQQGKQEELLLLIDRAINDLQENMVLHPRDVRLYLSAVDLYQQRASITRDTENIQSATEMAEKAVFYSSHRQQALFTLASLMVQQGRFDDAERVLITTKDFDQQIGEGWLRLLAHYVDRGDMEKARAFLEEYESYDGVVVFSLSEKSIWEKMIRTVETI
jgi:hypothetical protein